MAPILMIRRSVASVIRRGAWSGLLTWDRTVAAVRTAPDRAYRAALHLSGIVAGCGCTDDGAECCARGDWCECPCHEGRA